MFTALRYAVITEVGVVIGMVKASVGVIITLFFIELMGGMVNSILQSDQYE